MSDGPAKPRKHYVVFTGSVAAGATTLTTVIQEEWDVETLLEGAIESINPFFQRAQADSTRWGLASQIHFLLSSVDRHRSLRELLYATDGHPVVVEDRTPFEHNGAYVRALRTLGALPADELDLLENVAQLAEEHYFVPDLLVYREMTDAQLTQRVQNRGREGEVDDPVRLQAIKDAFEVFIDGWDRSPSVRIPADLDLVTPEGAQAAIDVIRPYWPDQ